VTPELMLPDARTVFERARKLRIMVAGDLMIDEWIWGTVTRISPEAPVPVVAVGDHSFTLGGAGNVANNLRALRANVVFAGTVGDDAFAGSRSTIPESLRRSIDRRRARPGSSRTTSKSCARIGSQPPRFRSKIDTGWQHSCASARRAAMPSS